METWRYTSGMWSTVAIAVKNWFGSGEDRLDDGSTGTDDLLGFGALAMTASTVKVGSRKKEKANGPSGLEKILSGCYIKLGSRSQESCVYLEIERLWCGKSIS